MSWIFGGSSSGDGSGDADDYDDEGGADYDDYDFEDDRDDDDDTRGGKVVADFDPSALERGAKAIKEIDASNNSKEVLKLAMMQEKTKQAESKLREQQLMAHNLAERERIMSAEREAQARRRQEEREEWKARQKAEMEQQRQIGKEQVEQKRMAQEQWLRQQKELNDQNLERQKEIEKQIEEERRRTLEYQAKLDRETAKVRAEAESEGRITQERKNEDIHLRAMTEKMKEERETKLSLRKEELEAYREFFSGFREFISDRDKVTLLSKVIVGTAFGIYVAKTGVNVTGRYIENHLGKPSLVRETSRFGWRDALPSKKWLTALRNRNNNNQKNSDELKGVILDSSLENRMKFITRSTRNTCKNQAPFRHLCIYGPPGTGKTLFARVLSKNSGMDYAILSGGDFTQLGSNAVTELHRVFDWAEASRSGTIIFIDEADAFLRRGRENDNTMSENMRNALSAFLYRTGTESRRFMIVLATNVPEALDRAVLDRIDDVVEFPLPKPNERKRMLEYYFNEYITQLDPETGQRVISKRGFLGMAQVRGGEIKVVGFEEDSDLFDRLTEKTEGFSGRQIAKFMIQVQATLYGSADGTELTPFLMEQILETFLKSKLMGLE